MTVARTHTAKSRRRGRSVVAIAAGFLSTLLLTLAADQLLHVLNVYPPWGEPMWDTALNILALTYRIAFTVFGGWVTAKLAPAEPKKHAIILATIGGVLGTISAIVSITQYNLGPAWYPFGIVVTSVPAILFGAELAAQRRERR